MRTSDPSTDQKPTDKRKGYRLGERVNSLVVRPGLARMSAHQSFPFKSRKQSTSQASGFPSISTLRVIVFPGQMDLPSGKSTFTFQGALTSASQRRRSEGFLTLTSTVSAKAALVTHKTPNTAQKNFFTSSSYLRACSAKKALTLSTSGGSTTSRRGSRSRSLKGSGQGGSFPRARFTASGNLAGCAVARQIMGL